MAGRPQTRGCDRSRRGQAVNKERSTETSRPHTGLLLRSPARPQGLGKVPALLRELRV